MLRDRRTNQKAKKKNKHFVFNLRIITFMAALEIVELKFGTSSVKVNLHGATLVSWKCNGEELIFVRYV